ncbi:hypothetical protein R9C00_11565 [Flammeovirgaceae bacterium SG7u.111]|nr:hypothetical protein [Flammeovirgaceae bacterium SG7u.132]WPO38090.1 hypothetical protein R9C00_11565 [Flammeovirgaceae bacterium SG7u.111]
MGGDLVLFIKTGLRPDGTLLAYPMMPYTQLTDEEAKAIFAYIKTVPVIENKVVVRP